MQVVRGSLLRRRAQDGSTPSTLSIPIFRLEQLKILKLWFEQDYKKLNLVMRVPFLVGEYYVTRENQDVPRLISSALTAPGLPIPRN